MVQTQGPCNSSDLGDLFFSEAEQPKINKTSRAILII